MEGNWLPPPPGSESIKERFYMLTDHFVVPVNDILQAHLAVAISFLVEPLTLAKVAIIRHHQTSPNKSQAISRRA